MAAFITDGTVNLDGLCQLRERPPPFAPGEPNVWDDSHISAAMHGAPLDPARDAVSRHPALIERSVCWLLDAFSLKLGGRILDLGCGPSL